MIISQKFTPKYWVINDLLTDDVYIATAAKGMRESINKYQEIMHRDYYQDFDAGRIQCNLVEIRLINVDDGK